MNDPEQIAVEIVHRFMLASESRDCASLENSIVAALQSKQDEIDKLREKVETLALEKANQQLHWNEERDELRARVEQAETRADDWFKSDSEQRTRAEQSERERDEALEGLRPFLERANWYSEQSPFTGDDWNVLCSLGHCRRAKEIIDKHEKK